MNFATLYKTALRKRAAAIKRAAAVLTPEAEQAAVQPPMDPSMAGSAPMDPSMTQGGGMPMQAAGPNGGQIPPEILQDQGFVQWLASQGVQLDPQSGTFIDTQSGQPLPAEAIMQAYEMYIQQMQGSAPMQPGQPPMDPSMAGGAPMDPSMMGGAPMDPSMGWQPPMDPSMGGQPPMDPSMAGGAPMDPSMMGGAPGAMPPEIMQDQGFLQFLQQAFGAQVDPQAGVILDPQTGQPIPAELLSQAYAAYQQQAGGGMPPPGGEAPMEPAAGGMPADVAGDAPAGIPPETLDQIQSAIDASIENYTAQLDKKIETLLDKLETVKQALESMRDTDDAREKAAKDESRQLQEDLAAELNPVVKTASAVPRQAAAPKPVNLFSLLMEGGLK